MLNQEELKWIAATSTELNSMLQQIARYSDLARQQKGESSYLEMLTERVDLASKTAQALFDRVTATILEGTAANGKRLRKRFQFPFSVVPSPRASAQDNASDQSGVPSTAEASSAAVDLAVDAEVQIANPEGARELILLVDDDAEMLKITTEMLTGEGYRIIAVKDGVEALKTYGRLGSQIGLVILDFFMPIMDGDAVFDELRELNPKANVVLSSGFAEQGKVQTMLKKGLRGFIPKPYTHEKLLQQVRTTFDAGKQIGH